MKNIKVILVLTSLALMNLCFFTSYKPEVKNFSLNAVFAEGSSDPCDPSDKHSCWNGRLVVQHMDERD